MSPYQLFITVFIDYTLLLPVLSFRSRTYSHTAIKHNFYVFVCQLKTIKM